MDTFTQVNVYFNYGQFFFFFFNACWLAQKRNIGNLALAFFKTY